MRLSLAMMVYNEEKDLPVALASIADAGIFDEVCFLVDDRTDDGTEGLLEGFAFEYPGIKVNYRRQAWEGMGKARTAACAMCTGDWVCSLDADEEILVQSKKGLKKFLERMPKGSNAVACVIHDMRGEKESRYRASSWSQVRFWRRGTVHFEGSIHHATVIDGSNEAALCEGVEFRHNGYGDQAERRLRRNAQTKEALLKDLEGGRLESHFYLGQIAGMEGKHKEAAGHYDAYIMVAENLGRKMLPQAWAVAARTHMRLGNKDKALEYINKGIARYTQDPDLAYTLSDWGIWAEDLEVALAGAKLFIKNFEAVANDPSILGSRWTTTMRDECYAIGLHRVAMLSLNAGVRHMEHLVKNLDRVNEETRKEITTEMVKNLTSFGLESLLPRDLAPSIIKPSREAVKLVASK